jgi:hypothetical protein
LDHPGGTTWHFGTGPHPAPQPAHKKKGFLTQRDRPPSHPAPQPDLPQHPAARPVPLSLVRVCHHTHDKYVGEMQNGNPENNVVAFGPAILPTAMMQAIWFRQLLLCPVLSILRPAPDCHKLLFAHSNQLIC